MEFAIRRVTVAEEDLAAAAALFDAYRQWYGCPADRERARRFVEERTRRAESAIFLAWGTDGAIGFLQLYPSFSSTAAQRIWVLNDLFVAAAARGRGVGRALLARARDHALETGAVRLVLETGAANGGAQRLYESVGYECENEAVRFYRLELRR